MAECILDLAQRRGKLRFLGRAAGIFRDSDTTHVQADKLVHAVVTRVCAHGEIDHLLVDPHVDALSFVADILEQTTTSIISVADGLLPSDIHRVVSVAQLVQQNVDCELGNSVHTDVAVAERLLVASGELL